jgi:hypothetical protein
MTAIGWVADWLLSEVSREKLTFALQHPKNHFDAPKTKLTMTADVTIEAR